METIRAARRVFVGHDKPGAYEMNMNSGDQASHKRVLFGETVKTARRADGDGGVSLARRRAWFVDETTGGTTNAASAANGTGQDSATGQSGAESIDTLPAWAQKLIGGLRDEAAQRRVELRRREDEEKARLAKMGEWETLASQHAAKVAELEPRAQRAGSLDEFVQSSLKVRIAAVPEAMRSLVPNFPDPLDTIKWLDANESKLRMPTAPNLDAGASGSGGTPISSEVADLARRMGVDLAKVQKYNSQT